MKTIRYTRLLAVSLLIAAMAGVSPRAAQQAPAQSTAAGASAAKVQPPGGGKGTPNQPQELDSDGDGLFDSEEPNILVDVNQPELGFLDPFDPDTCATGTFDGQKDSDHDGITNLGELRKFASAPSNAHTFSATKDDAEYLFTARPFQNDTMARVDIANLGGGVFQFTISGANANAQYDLYFVNNLFAQRWQWRRVYSGVACDSAGQATFQLQGPDPNQAFFVILSAGDTDLDGLTDGYESWFTYTGGRTKVDNQDSEVVADGLLDNWEVEYGLDPTVDAGDDGTTGDPDNDEIFNLQEHNAYSFVDGSYDPLKAYNTPANRPVVSISSSCQDSSFTFTRAVGIAGTFANPLTVYYALGGNATYGTDYTVSPAPPDYPRIFSVVIPANESSVTVFVTPLVGNLSPCGQTVVATVTPYSVSPVSQVPTPGNWTYAVDWNNNRAAIRVRPIPMDVAFIFDNTFSVGNQPLTQLRNGIATVLNDIVASSGSDYRLALVTPDQNQVHVRLNFSANNRSLFEAALNAVTLSSGGAGDPESTDECLNTVLNALPASGRTDPRQCTPPDAQLQMGDFAPAFRPFVRKLVVMITDAEPGGFCDFAEEEHAEAHQYALQARADCVKINAIQVGSDFLAESVMLDYSQTSCGWYSQIPADGTGIVDAVVKMLHTVDVCGCP